MSPLADASAETLHAFVMDHVEPGSTIITDGWPAYQGLAQLGYEHGRRSQGAARARGDDPNKLLPAVHRVVSLAKRWLLGTHQGAADSTHMSHYLNEFVFRFNRRRSRSRGMVFYRVLELAVAHEPMRFQDLIASRRPNTDGGRDALRLNGYPQVALIASNKGFVNPWGRSTRRNRQSRLRSSPVPREVFLTRRSGPGLD